MEQLDSGNLEHRVRMATSIHLQSKDKLGLELAGIESRFARLEQTSTAVSFVCSSKAKQKVHKCRHSNKPWQR